MEPARQKRGSRGSLSSRSEKSGSRPSSRGSSHKSGKTRSKSKEKSNVDESKEVAFHEAAQEYKIDYTDSEEIVYDAEDDIKVAEAPLAEDVNLEPYIDDEAVKSMLGGGDLDQETGECVLTCAD